jgi:hypothetical protein
MKTTSKALSLQCSKLNHIIKSKVPLMKVKQTAHSRLIRIWDTQEAILPVSILLGLSNLMCVSAPLKLRWQSPADKQPSNLECMFA